MRSGESGPGFRHSRNIVASTPSSSERRIDIAKSEAHTLPAELRLRAG